ncbi:hypothetical protein GGF32_009157 [Allomyces javanicus]|nr:hypothetical protein GGF32_009157 [Allomyces javanicus]
MADDCYDQGPRARGEEDITVVPHLLQDTTVVLDVLLSAVLDPALLVGLLNILVIDEPDVHLVTDDAVAPGDDDHDQGITAVIDPGVDANLFVITDREAPLSSAAKQRTVASIEIKDPFFDGSLEMIVRDWHKEHGIDIIYCKHEEFLLRIANLRKLLGIKEGLQPENTVTFRDKVAMKKRAAASQFPVPKYQRIYSPSCLLSFIDCVGLPVIVKPTLGCAPFGVRILRTMTDVTKYLRTDFFAFLRTSLTSEAGQFDMAGQMIAEAYLETATMHHVNGLVDQGKLVAVWPFQCVRSYLNLAQGVAAGSLALVPGDAEYAPIIDATSRLLKCYDLPSRFAFHLEMFRVPSVAAARHQLDNAPVCASDQSRYVLCELGARPPSASLPAMISAHIGSSLDELDFRFSAGLSYSLPALSAQALAASRVGDLLIPPRRYARIVHMPKASAFPTELKRHGVQYVPIAEDGLEYSTYAIDTKPSVARMVARGGMSVEGMTAKLMEAERWFASQIVYEPLGECKGKDGEKKEGLNGSSSNGSSQY